MVQNKIKIIKSPIVSMDTKDRDWIVYGNQVTYSVRLQNGMVVSSPDAYPNEINEEKSCSEKESE